MIGDKTFLQLRPWGLALAVSIALVGCGESNSSSQGDSFGGGAGGGDKDTVITFNETEMLTHLTDNVITPAFETVNQRAQEQHQAIAGYCQALTDSADSDVVATAKQQAQESWRQAMDAWQQVEVMQVGPLNTNHNALRNTLYSWPVTNSCSVDQDVIYFSQGQINTTPYDISNRTDTRRGLDSLEYLLFNDELSHSCRTDNGIVQNWNASDEAERVLSRCGYAEEVGRDLVVNTTSLLDKWLGDDGFAAEFKQAGNAGNSFDSAHAAVNAISDALFYVDSLTKDAKLAQPLGIANNGCGNDACTESVESPLSGHSLSNIINNLIGLQKIYLGQGDNSETRLGFYDFMVDLDDKANADVMASDIEAAIAFAQGMEQSLLASLESNPEDVTALHARVKRITDQLKTNYITLLALELPATSAGDND